MTTIFVATDPRELCNLFPWAHALAKSRNEDLEVLLPIRKAGESRLVTVGVAPEADEHELITTARQAYASANVEFGSEDVFPVQALYGEGWQRDLASHLQTLKPELVVVPAPVISKDQSVEDDWQTELLQAVECNVLLLRDDSAGVRENPKLAVLVTDGADNEAALDCALSLSDSTAGSATAIYLQSNVSEEARNVGLRRLDNLLNRTLGRSKREALKHRVLVARSTSEAFREIGSADFDLLLTGTRDLREIRRFLAADFGRGAGEQESIPAVAVLKRGEQFSQRLLNRFDRAVRAVVPQLTREERVNLVTRIQDSSNWDFDFVFLISLATLIACFGLAENSGAVIVGAMLVAPLMTPIAGVGLGVAHANLLLTRVAFRTAIRGFATSVIIGLLFGAFVQVFSQLGWLEPLFDEHAGSFNSEMENRTRPQFYDLLIALASGIAAAYAMGRPNLYSALPGVAIAAALVPPIATSGIALAYGNVIKGGGALLLFVANMVTIILGTSLTFRMVGVMSQKEGPNAARWPRYVLLLLVILSLAATVAIEINRRRG